MGLATLEASKRVGHHLNVNANTHMRHTDINNWKPGTPEGLLYRHFSTQELPQVLEYIDERASLGLSK